MRLKAFFTPFILICGLSFMIPSIVYSYGARCKQTHFKCDHQTFQNLFSSLVMARVLEQKDKFGLQLNRDLGITKTVGKASCYANTEFCQGARADNYAYRTTASGVCADPDKYTAAIDVKAGDPIYGSRRLGSLVFANNNGKSAVFVVTDRGLMNKHGVKFDLVEGVVKKIKNSRQKPIEFYGLKKQSVQLSKVEMDQTVNCVTMFNNSFDPSNSHLPQLTSEQKLNIEVATVQKLKELGVAESSMNLNHNLASNSFSNINKITDELERSQQDIDEKLEQLFKMYERKEKSWRSQRTPASNKKNNSMNSKAKSHAISHAK